MDLQDKGIALPADSGAWGSKKSAAGKMSAQARRAEIERRDSTWSRSTRVLDILRHAGPDGAVTDIIAKQLRESISMTTSVLIGLRKRAEVLSDITDDGETRWFITRKKFKQHVDKVARQSAEAMGWLRDWTISSVCARMKNGIEVSASYPYVRATEQ